MPDPRVSHFWDADREAYFWFPDQEGYRDLIFGPVAWDIFFLYSPEATWDDIPWPVVSSGSTIIRKRQDLADGLRSLLGEDN